MRYWFAALALVGLANAASAEETQRDPTSAALDACLAAPDKQSMGSQSDCFSRAERDFDRRMNAAYASILQRLPGPAGERLRQSQRAWIAYRDAETQARRAIYETRRGTMYVPMESDAAVALIGDRARMLERYERALDIDP